MDKKIDCKVHGKDQDMIHINTSNVYACEKCVRHGVNKSLFSYSSKPKPTMGGKEMKSDFHKFLDKECSDICAFCSHSEPKLVIGEEDYGLREPYCKIKHEYVDPSDSCEKFNPNGNKWEKL